MSENLSNGAQTTLNGALNNSQTTATLTSASGWPEAPFRALIVAESGNVDEIIYVGARSGTALSSITRAAEPIADGTQVAVAHSSGATITQVLTRVGLINQGLNSGTIGAKVYHSTTQAANSGDALLFDSEEFDTDGFHSTSSNTSRLTIPAGLSGYYLAIAHGERTTGTLTDFLIRKNGTDKVIGSYTSMAFGVISSAVVYLNSGDYLEAIVGSTATYGDTTTPSQYNSFSIIKLDSGKVGSGVGTKVYNAGTQSIPNNTITPVTFDSEEFDTDSFHSTSVNTSRFTIPAGLGGIYSLSYGTNATTSNTWELGFRLNGTTLLRGWSGGGASYFAGSTVTRLIGGDYVELVAFQSTGGSVTIGNATNADAQTWASLMRLDSLAAPVSSGATGTVGALVKPSTNTTAGTGSYAALNIFDQEVFDTDGFHSASPNSRLTIPTGLSGKYLIVLKTYALSGSAGSYVAIHKNGTTYIGYDESAGSSAMSEVVLIVDAVAGDYFDAETSSGSNSWQADGTSYGIYKLDSGKVGTGVGAKAYNSTLQSIPNTTYTALTLDSERWDTDGFHSTSSNTSRMTIPVGLSGKYLVTASSQSASNGTGDRYITFFVNGVNVGPQTWSVGSTSTTEPQTTGILDLVAGDYVEAYIWQNSGGALNYGDATNAYVQTTFSIMRLDSQPSATGTAATTINSRPYLDRLPALHTTYGDDFEATSLDAKWTLRTLVTGDLSFAEASTYLRINMGTGTTDKQLFQPAPAGDFEIVCSWVEYSSNGTMHGPLIVSSTGAGVAGTLYDNSNFAYLGVLSAYTYSSGPVSLPLLTVHFRENIKIWMGLKKVGTNYSIRFSLNGDIWSPYSSTSSQAFTVDRIGFGRIYSTGAVSTNFVALDKFNVI